MSHCDKNNVHFPLDSVKDFNVSFTGFEGHVNNHGTCSLPSSLMYDQLSLNFDSTYCANQAVQPDAWGIIHKAPYVSNKYIVHKYTNTTNIYSIVGNKAVVYNEYGHKHLSDLGGVTNPFHYTLCQVSIFSNFQGYADHGAQLVFIHPTETGTISGFHSMYTHNGNLLFVPHPGPIVGPLEVHSVISVWCSGTLQYRLISLLTDNKKSNGRVAYGN